MPNRPPSNAASSPIGAQALRETTQRLNIALEAAFMISFEWDIVENRVRRFMSTSPGLPSDGGPRTLEEVRDIVHPDDREHFMAKVQAALDNPGGRYHSEFRLATADGEVIWVAEFGHVERDPEGRPLRLVGLTQDIRERKRMEEAGRESEGALALALEATGLGMFDFYPQTGKLTWDELAKRHFGLSPDAEVDYDVFLRGLHYDDRERVNEVVQRVMQPSSGGQYHMEYRTVGIEDAKERWLDARGRIFFDAQGKAARFIGCTLDITERKRAEEERIRLNEHLQIALEAAHMATWEYNPTTGEVILSEKAHEVLNQPGGRWHQNSDEGYGLIHPDDVERHRALVTGAIATGGSYVSEYRHAHGEQVVWLEERGRAVLDKTGKTVRLVGVTQNITNRKLAEERMQYLAHYDLLTGIPNRTLIQIRLEDMVKRAERHHYRAAVLYIDLDNFKPVNDSFGHQVGDELLHNAAQRLSGCVRTTDTVGRMGGDEFVVLLDELGDVEEAAWIAKNILDTLARPFYLAGQQLYVSASIGIACYPSDGKMAETLLRHADAAMYRAKEEGKNIYQFFSSAMNRNAHEKLLLIASLRQAIEQDELALCYQPRVRAQSGNLLGVEALVRWHSPVHGLVLPNRFIGFAEETGMIEPIGEWVLRTACEQMKHWESNGRSPAFVSVNLSARQLHQPKLAERVERILTETALPPHRLELEITETVVMANPEKATLALRRLAERGIRLSLDDFGTGHSSLAYLQRFPVHHIKLDQSFVRELPHNRDSVAIVKAIVAMARSLELGVTAEGVETESQRDFLAQTGCHALQGYFFSKPITAKELELFWLR